MKKNLLFFLFFILSSQLKAQLLGIRHFRMDENSTKIKIFTFAKKSNGYIYVGTSNGLYKFDGIKFIMVPFKNPVTNSGITAIFEDNSHQLWVGMESGDIGILLNGFINLFNPEEGTPKKMITSFIQDKLDNIWFSTNGEGLYFIENKHLYNINTDDGLPDKYVHVLALADNGDVIAGTDQGLSICSISGHKKHIVNLTSKNGLPDNLIKVIKPISDNNFYIGMQDGGICIYDHANKKFIISQTPTTKYGQVNAILVSKNKLWIGTENEGLLKQTGLNGLINYVETGGKNSNINNILRDNEGNAWLLVNNNELIKTSGEQVSLIIDYQASDFEKVHAILYDNQSDIFRATPHGLIKYFNNNETKKQRVFNIRELNEKTSITALYQDINDHIWIGTMGKGLFLLDEYSGEYRKINEDPLFAKGSVLSITGKGNDIFISTLEGAAHFIVRKDPSISAPMNYKEFSGLDSIGTNYIYNIFQDSKGRIWFASDGKYISVLENGKFINYNEKNGIRDKVIYSITEDINGNIWFSTHSDGIYKFDGRIFKNYSVTDGLSDIDISAVKTDKQGNIIIVYKKGIDILNPETGQVSYLNGNQGLKELNVQDLGTVAQDSSGSILVSTTDGIVSYHPLENAIHQPKTILENVQLFFSDINKDSVNTFSYIENSFSFSFTGLYYTDPEAIQYKYKLEGYDTHWLITKDRTIAFPKLAPGKYKFLVRSSINQVFNGANEASFEFIIAKPFWTTWWFIIVCFLSSGFLLYWFIKIRERNVKKVGQLQQEKIKFQFETLRNQVNPHFLFNSFNTLITIIEDDPQMAVEYVEQLSDFFRNIVTYRDIDVITLKEELRLLETYLFIQKKRFGSNLDLIIDIPDEAQLHNFIPPLTLQLLGENAIKHNAISKETPLIITIYMEDDYIVVDNNINTRLSRPEGAGMGLQNIVNRYNLLNKKNVIIKNDSKHFVVSLPTLKKQS